MNIISLDHAGSKPKSMGIAGFPFREHPICTLTAAIVAVLYWISVWAACRSAQANNTGLGYEWVPFMILSAPWWSVAGIGTLCLLLCGINATVVFVVGYVILSWLFDRWLGA
jgi:hypothetical protein